MDKETAGLTDCFVKALDARIEHLNEPQQAQGFGESRENSFGLIEFYSMGEIRQRLLRNLGCGGERWS